MSGYGEQLWSPNTPRNLDDQPTVRAMIGGRYWFNDEGNFEDRGWVTSDVGQDIDGRYALRTMDATLASLLISGGDSAATILDGIRTVLTDRLPVNGTGLVELADVVLNLAAGVVGYTDWVNVAPFDSVGAFMHNTGANPLDVAVMPIASGVNGGGIVAVGTGSAFALAAGTTSSWDYLTAGTVPTGATQNASKTRAVFASFRLGFRSPVGTTLRVVLLGRKPWAV